MIDTTTHNFNHCGAANAAAAAASASSNSSSNSGSSSNSISRTSRNNIIHLSTSSEQQLNYYHQQHSNYNYAPTVHHLHQQPASNSIGAAEKYSTSKVAACEQEQQYYYNNHEAAHYWPSNCFSGNNQPPDAAEAKSQWHGQHTDRVKESTTTARAAENEDENNIYQSARAGFSPSSAAALYQTSSDPTAAAAAPADDFQPEAAAAAGAAKEQQKQSTSEFSQLRILEMRKEKSRDAARSRRSKENHEFYELAKLLPLPAAITSQLDFLDKASIIRLTISFLKLRQFSVNGHPPWAPDFATLGSINPYSSTTTTSSFSPDVTYSTSSGQEDGSRPTSVKHIISPAQTPSGHRLPTTATAATAHSNPQQTTAYLSQSSAAAFPSSQIDAPYGAASLQTFSSESKHSNNNYHVVKSAASLFDIHQGTHILQSLDGFAFAVGRDGRFLYISETVSMYLGLSQVEMTGSSVFDYTHQQDHDELARHLGIQNPSRDTDSDAPIICSTTTALVSQQQQQRPGSVHSQYSAASNETLIDDYVNQSAPQRKRMKSTAIATTARGAYSRANSSAKKNSISGPGSTKTTAIKIEASDNDTSAATGRDLHDEEIEGEQGTEEDPLVRQFCIRMKSTLTKRGCQHFKSSGYRVVHVVAHLRSYQSNDHGHLMDPLDEPALLSGASNSATSNKQGSGKRRTTKSSNKQTDKQQELAASIKMAPNDNSELLDSAATTTSRRQRLCKPKIIGMVAVAIALPPPSINELRLESDTFVLRLSLDLKITHIEPRITELLHYPVELIAGRSLYSLIHPADAYQVQKCHRDLLSKGQMMSGYYRLLARNGGYIWIQTCATLICNNSNTSNNANASSSLGQVVPQSPSSVTGGNPMTPLSVLGVGDQKLPGYLAPSNSGAQQPPKLLGSPGMSSHISSLSNYDNMDQDQCVIFVNYMISNVIESDKMIDICQSSDFAPVVPANAFGVGPAAATNNNTIYNSPSSSCSSPCMPSLKSNNSNGNYVQSTTPISAHMTATSGHRNTHAARQAQSKEISKSRRAINKTSKSASSYLTSADHEENGTYTSSNHHVDNHQHTSMIHESSNEIPSDTTLVGSMYASHYQSTPGVNLALNNNNNNNNNNNSTKVLDNNHWLQPTTNHLTNDGGATAATAAAAAAMAYGTSQADQHYASSMDRSSAAIYKAAFGLGGGSGYGSTIGAHHHHQHQQQQHQQQHYSTSTGQVVAYGSAAAVAAAPASAVGCNTWDNAAAVAAVAAASSHLTSHHHHHAAPAAANPYAHLEPHHHHHHQHHQAAVVAAAALNPHNHPHQAAATNHHHQAAAAGNYYNYYGYYGNKFI